MKIFKFIILALLLFSFNFLNATEESLSIKITKNLRCLICQGQSVHDSDSEFANSLKIVVRNKISEGLQEDEIYEFLRIKYGEWILYEPELNKKTYILWLLPLLLFLIGGAIIFKNLKIKKN
tara:strand:+ start:9068 stop:9433 length:366 start_codon:yes stop_codon:yes gene_type:complete